MATSSIFRTPQFETEESARSLIEAIEATMSVPKPDYKHGEIKVRQIRDAAEIRRVLDLTK